VHPKLDVSTKGKNVMNAVGYKKPLTISDAESLLDIEVPTPKAAGRDVLVEVKAISVNPVDVKVRASTAPEGTQLPANLLQAQRDYIGVPGVTTHDVTVSHGEVRHSAPARVTAGWRLSSIFVTGLPRFSPQGVPPPPPHTCNLRIQRRISPRPRDVPGVERDLL
jgi:hypothetical protein